MFDFSLKCEWNYSHSLVVRNNEDDNFAQISGGNTGYIGLSDI